MASLEVAKTSCLSQFELPLCCDSVEWCDFDGFDSIIGVGHYELTNNQSKIGGITLFKQNEIKSNDSSLNKISFKQTPPILDLKWHSLSSMITNEEKTNDINNKTSIYLSAATSIGTIELYSLYETDKKVFELELKSKLKIANIDDDKSEKLPICLSLDWNKQNNNLCVTSLSDGSICILQFDDNKSSILSRIKLHSDQVWISCFDKYNDKIIYSGADDCLFSIWDFRKNNNDKAIYKDDTTHKMGICSITDSFDDEYLLLTGSYDEYLRLWDKRNMKEPIDCLKFNDGIWRIKWCPNNNNKDKILIATMRDHFNIVQFDKNTQKLNKLYSYTGHYDNYKNNIYKKQKEEEELDILAYGCDWSTNNLIASCSFYDKQFHCWTC